MKLKMAMKWIGASLLTIVGLVLLVVVIQILRFDRARRAIHDVPLPAITASSDSAVIARGRHLAESFGGCVACHGATLGGKLGEDIENILVIRAPNLTRGGRGSLYSDGQLARAIRYGVRMDGTSLVFMPTPEHNWWPDEDLTAIVSYIRSVPAVEGAMEPPEVRPLGKLLHEFGIFEMLSAETVDPDAAREAVPAPEPTARYGAFLARGCIGCHGERLSGGKIPGAPSTLPIPRNLTPHETGLGNWTEEQFMSLLNTGIRPDGRRLDPFMPIATVQSANETEKRALWAYLRSIEPIAFGNR